MASKAVLVCSGKGGTRGKFELHEPRLVICPECKTTFSTFSATKRFCNNRCMWRWHDRKRRSYQRLWDAKHPDKRRIYRKTAQNKIQSQWHDGECPVYTNHTNPLVIQSEFFVSSEVLPKHGFMDILLTRSFSAFFPCDILARKDGQICLIEVTLAFDRKINKRLAPLVRFLNARAFVCHVRPNFEEYYLKEVTGKTYSSCRKVFMEEVRQHA